jgi:hypothetical protein
MKGYLHVSKSHEDVRKFKSMYNIPSGSSNQMDTNLDPTQVSFLEIPVIDQSTSRSGRRRYHSDTIVEGLFLTPLPDSQSPGFLDDESNFSPETDSIPRSHIQTQTSFLSLPKAELTPELTSIALIKHGARYVQFAVGAYGTNFLKMMGIEKPRGDRFDGKDEHHNHYSLANHIDVPVDHIVSSSFDSLATLHAPRLIAPVHYVVVDQESKSVVVSLRGTLGLSDIVTDLMASYAHYKYEDGIDGYVHSGSFLL